MSDLAEGWLVFWREIRLTTRGVGFLTAVVAFDLFGNLLGGFVRRLLR